MTESLRTLCDFIRFAVSRFEAAALVYGHGTDNAFDEAVFLILETLKLPNERLEAFWNAKLTEEERERIFALIDERVLTRKPAPYLVNKAYIQDYPFYVDEHVIVPRSFIAEILCGELSPVDAPESVTRVLDLCTGSGCLAVIASHLYENAEIDATDLSPEAIAVAGHNISDYGLEERIWLYCGDLFGPLPEGAQYDLIIANPPYVDAEAMDTLPPEFRAEPELSLAAGQDGLDIIRRIIDRAPDHLNEGGLLICEVGRCGPALQEEYPDLPFSWLETENSNGEVFFITREELTEESGTEEETDEDDEEYEEEEEDEDDDDEDEEDEDSEEEYEEDCNDSDEYEDEVGEDEDQEEAAPEPLRAIPIKRRYPR